MATDPQSSQVQVYSGVNGFLHDLREEIDASDVFKRHDTRDSFAKENEKYLRARNELLKLIKDAPNWQLALRVSPGMRDIEVLYALRRSDSPRATLRLAGCSAADSVHGSTLLPLALSYQPPPLGKACSERIGFRGVCIIIFFVLILTAIAAVIFYSFEKAGWKEAKCNIEQFSNTTPNAPCPGKCLFDVSVAQKPSAGTASLTKRFWSPPRAKEPYRNGHTVRFKDDVFRCCSMQTTLVSCCSFIDVPSQTFCDNWPHRATLDGRPCPNGHWPCLFKTLPSNPMQVDDLKPDYDVPMQTHSQRALIILIALATIPVVICHPRVWVCLQNCIARVCSKMNLWVSPAERAVITTQKEMHDPRSLSLPRTMSKRQDTVSLDAEFKQTLKKSSTMTSEHSQPSFAASQPASSRSNLEPPSSGQDTTLRISAISCVAPEPQDIEKRRPALSNSQETSPRPHANIKQEDTNDGVVTSNDDDIENVFQSRLHRVAKTRASRETLSSINTRDQADLIEAMTPLEEKKIMQYSRQSLQYMQKLAAQTDESTSQFFRPIMTPLSRPHGRSRTPNGGLRSPHRNGSHHTNMTLPTADPRSPTGLRLEGSTVDDPHKWNWAGQEDSPVDGYHIVDVGRDNMFADQFPSPKPLANAQAAWASPRAAASRPRAAHQRSRGKWTTPVSAPPVRSKVADGS